MSDLIGTYETDKLDYIDIFNIHKHYNEWYASENPLIWNNQAINRNLLQRHDIIIDDRELIFYITPDSKTFIFEQNDDKITLSIRLPLYETIIQHKKDGTKYSINDEHDINNAVTSGFFLPIYEGKWNNEFPHGYGKLYCYDKFAYVAKHLESIFEGTFENGYIIYGIHSFMYSIDKKQKQLQYGKYKTLLAFYDPDSEPDLMIGNSNYVKIIKYSGYFQNNIYHGNGLFHQDTTIIRANISAKDTNFDYFKSKYIDNHKICTGTITIYRKSLPYENYSLYCYLLNQNLIESSETNLTNIHNIYKYDNVKKEISNEIRIITSKIPRVAFEVYMIATIDYIDQYDSISEEQLYFMNKKSYYSVLYQNPVIFNSIPTFKHRFEGYIELNHDMLNFLKFDNIKFQKNHGKVFNNIDNYLIKDGNYCHNNIFGYFKYQYQCKLLNSKNEIIFNEFELFDGNDDAQSLKCTMKSKYNDNNVYLSLPFTSEIMEDFIENTDDNIQLIGNICRKISISKYNSSLKTMRTRTVLNKQPQPQGQCTYKNESKNLTIKGTFRDGIMHGFVNIYYQDCAFIGFYENGHPKGYGLLIQNYHINDNFDTNYYDDESIINYVNDNFPIYIDETIFSIMIQNKQYVFGYWNQNKLYFDEKSSLIETNGKYYSEDNTKCLNIYNIEETKHNNVEKRKINDSDSNLDTDPDENDEYEEQIVYVKKTKKARISKKSEETDNLTNLFGQFNAFNQSESKFSFGIS